MPDREHAIRLAPEDANKPWAADMIEAAGFARGHARGGAAISTKHTLALTNRGGATAADVVALARDIREGVRERFGVNLTPEPILAGFGDDAF